MVKLISGQFGLPTFGAGAFTAFLAVTVASMVESVGDYQATAIICNVPKPPTHSINRGILAGYIWY